MHHSIPSTIIPGEFLEVVKKPRAKNFMQMHDLEDKIVTTRKEYCRRSGQRCLLINVELSEFYRNSISKKFKCVSNYSLTMLSSLS